MNDYTVRRLALVLAVQAEIEGMKAENMQREQQGYSMAWTETDFCQKAEELRNLANCSSCAFAKLRSSHSF